MRSAEVARALDELSLVVVATLTLRELADSIAALSHEALDPATGAAVFVLDGRGRLGEPGASDDRSWRVAMSAYGGGDGPGPSACRQGHVVTVADTAAIGCLWPDFGDCALRNHVRSALSLPLLVGAEPVGALTLYAAERAAFRRRDEADAALIAQRAAVVVANARAYWDATHRADGYEEAMRSRAVIEQAKGTIMAERGCDADEAFAMLARASQGMNIKVRDLARRLIDATTEPRRRRPPPGADSTRASSPT